MAPQFQSAPMASIPLRNRIRSFVGSVFRRPMIRAKDRFLCTARVACRETQQQTLKRLLSLNADSRFSREHLLAANLSVDEFRKRLAVSDYEVFRPWIQQMQRGAHDALLGSNNKLLMYAITSGTTDKAKLIPITDHFIRDYRRSWQHWGIATHQSHPRIQLLHIVQIISSHNRSRTDDGTSCGNISGLVTSMQKSIIRKLYTVPGQAAQIDDANAKKYVTARFAFADSCVGMFVTANPGTLLQLMEFSNANAVRLIRDIHDGTLTDAALSESEAISLRPFLKTSPARAAALEAIMSECNVLSPSRCWPELQCLAVWTGGSAGAYAPQLQQTFGDIALRDHGLHASEGRMTIPIEDNTPAGVLDIESHFFEFIPVGEIESADPVVLEAHELERDTEYFILLTTSSGLYRYNIFDVVRCTGFFGATPMLEFRHKGQHLSSIAGEKLSESQVVESVGAACRQAGVSLAQFTLTPAWGQPPGYKLFVKSAALRTAEGHDRDRLARAVDTALCQRNCEYSEKRSTNRLAMVRCELVSEVSWSRFARNRLRASGGSPEQYKHPCLLPDPQFEDLFVTSSQGTVNTS
ncbi:MAG: GH3 auxin-responsive promoter family protein [Fuerstiella sp.]|nr:GH3 auxin-responsive promoter family protein [Fuerstiella sp.]MCP4854586.1 GH3 auxin-responsive promoter family protein [Fuerstiella sp.]